MCFYNSNSKRAISLAARYGRKTDILEIVQEILEEQYCISAFTLPDSAIITESDQIQVNKWGLIPSWIKTPEDAEKIRKMTLNARAETVFNLPSYRMAIKKQRCLVPSTGFFEFHHEEKTVTPYYIHLKEDEIFSLGGIYESWENR
jgi:putative SOS response-associated peptidase YedK